MDISSILAALLRYDALDKSLLSRLARAASSSDRDAMLLIAQELLSSFGPSTPTSIVDVIKDLIDTLTGRK